jgi:hypothetical protein
MSTVLDDEERAALRQEIAAHGFEADPFVAVEPWARTWGLNLAVAWPLPVDRGAYQGLAEGLAALDPGLFVYPQAQTHITVLTLVSFKEHVEPSGEELRPLAALIPIVNEVVAPLARGFGPFELELGTPELSRRAAFVPVRDAAGAVARFRAEVLPALRARSPAFERCQAPRAVHATLARFRTAPGPAFQRRFEVWAKDGALGPIWVSAMLVTTETQPYMRQGEVVSAWPL